jgi:hypothetical protein
MTAFETGFRLQADKAVILAAIGDKIADRANLHAMVAGKTDEIIEPGHRAIIAHDFADHAAGVKARKARNVHGGLCMARTDKDAAGSCAQRENVAGAGEVARSLAAVDGDRDGAGAVCGGDAGGDAFLGLNRDRKRGAERGAVAAAHRLQTEVIDALVAERETDQTATIGGHEIDRRGCGHLRGDDKVTFVLAIFVIDEDIHATVARFLDDFLDADQHRRFVAGVEKAFEFAQRFGGGVPIVLVHIAQRVGVEASGARQTGAGQTAFVDEGADAGDDVLCHSPLDSHIEM